MKQRRPAVFLLSSLTPNARAQTAQAAIRTAKDGWTVDDPKGRKPSVASSRVWLFDSGGTDGVWTRGREAPRRFTADGERNAPGDSS